MELVILVGTMTGTANLVAQEIELTYGDDQVAISVVQMDDLTPAVFESGKTYLICTSTYGQGDVPDNALPFFNALHAERPDLSAIPFGVLGLGDMTYADTFNYGGAKFEAILLELGAKQIGERAIIDASLGELPEDMGVEWMAQWLEQAKETAAGLY
ncbi:MAG: flavodoxin domain-containing protein [Burkholderiaceae bacterium]